MIRENSIVTELHEDRYTKGQRSCVEKLEIDCCNISENSLGKLSF